MTPQTTEPTTVSDERPRGLASTIGWAATSLEQRLSAGDVAELRRAGPHRPYSPALWKLLVELDDISWSSPQLTEEALKAGGLTEHAPDA